MQVFSLKGGTLMDRALLIVKPDAFERGLEHAILQRVRDAGFRIRHAETRRLSRREVEELYAEHRGKPFFKVNTEFILSGPVGLFIVEFDGDTVREIRRLVGNKKPELARKGTIRGDFGIDPVHLERNLVHASTSHEAAEREIALLIEKKQISRRKDT